MVSDGELPSQRGALVGRPDQLCSFPFGLAERSDCLLSRASCTARLLWVRLLCSLRNHSFLIDFGRV